MRWHCSQPEQRYSLPISSGLKSPLSSSSILCESNIHVTSIILTASVRSALFNDAVSAYIFAMGHSRQDGGFAEAPQPKLEGYELPESAAGLMAGLRPEMQALPMVLPAKP